jgi:hypothetical protein
LKSDRPSAISHQPSAIGKEYFAMIQFFKNMGSNLGIFGEVLKFLWARKLWWLIPMIVVLLLFGILIIFASTSGLGPLIYTLF